MATVTDALRGQLSPEIIALLERELISDDEDLSIKLGGTPIIWRPGATGANAAGVNVFVDWGRAYALSRALIDEGSQDGVEIIVDTTDSQDADFWFGFFPVARIPAGVWNMDRIRLSVTNFRTSMYIEFADGCEMQNLTELGGGYMELINASTTDVPIDSSRLDVFCEYIRFNSFNPAVAPILKDTSGAGILNLHVSTFYQIARFIGGFGSVPAPVIDVGASPGAYYNIWASGGPGVIRNNAFTDSSGLANPADAAFLEFALNNQSQSPGAGSASWDFPDLTAATTLVEANHNQGLSRSFVGMAADASSGSPLSSATDLSATIQEDYQTLDSSGGAFAITLPKASPVAGRVLEFKGVAGALGVTNVTLNCAGTDTFEDGSTAVVMATNYEHVRFVSLGNGTWLRS